MVYRSSVMDAIPMRNLAAHCVGRATNGEIAMTADETWDRRAFLRAGAASAAAASLGCATSRTGEELSAVPEFHTSLCDLLGIRYPIVQSGMGGVAGPALAAAVSQAGGLGVIAGAHLAPDEIRRRI